jgi:hypothetical protein
LVDCRGISQEEEAETSRIDIAQLGPVHEVNACVEMLRFRARSARCLPFELSGHSEVHHKAIGFAASRMQRNHDRLSAPVDAFDARAGQHGNPRAAATIQVCRGQRSADDIPAGQVVAQFAHDRFDFGQFRHDGRSIHRP